MPHRGFIRNLDLSQNQLNCGITNGFTKWYKRRQATVTAVIIQARMGSTRLPGKVMMDLEGKTVLARVVERVQCTNYANDICVATTTLSEDDKIVSEAIDLGVKFYRGSENDVLDRYCEAAKYMKADHIIRVTADNPLTEPRFIDACGMKIVNEQLDYVTSWDVPYGSNSEAISLKALQKSTQFAKNNIPL